MKGREMKKSTCYMCGVELVRVAFLYTIKDGCSGATDWAEPGWKCPRCGGTWTDQQIIDLGQLWECPKTYSLPPQGYRTI